MVYYCTFLKLIIVIFYRLTCRTTFATRFFILCPKKFAFCFLFLFYYTHFKHIIALPVENSLQKTNPISFVFQTIDFLSYSLPGVNLHDKKRSKEKGEGRGGVGGWRL
jgi:hypothetical protein